MSLDFAYMLEAVPSLLRFVPVTLFLAVTAMVISIVVGLILALCRFTKAPVLDQLAQVYISFFRGVPTLVQLFLVYFGLPQIFPAMAGMGAMTAAIIGLGLKEASYLAEIFRAGLASVDRGQYEAGLATGLKPSQIYRHYIIPQAAYNALPATGTIFIGLIKETSIVFTLGITDLFARAQMTAANNFLYFETYLVAGLIYWVIILIVGGLNNMAEKRLGAPYQR